MPDRTIFWRTRSGKVVHVEGCPVLRRTKRAWRWNWAEREGITSKQQMLDYISTVDWLKACSVCLGQKEDD